MSKLTQIPLTLALTERAQTGTMQVFVNGVEQKVAIATIPVQGPLYYFVELLSDSQEIRIRPGAGPPLHPNVFTRAV